jgi:hypothetical protein
VAVEEYAVDKTDYMSKTIVIATPIIFQQRTSVLSLAHPPRVYPHL